jgi:hypothetical protein
MREVMFRGEGNNGFTRAIADAAQSFPSSCKPHFTIVFVSCIRPARVRIQQQIRRPGTALAINGVGASSLERASCCPLRLVQEREPEPVITEPNRTPISPVYPLFLLNFYLYP